MNETNVPLPARWKNVFCLERMAEQKMEVMFGWSDDDVHPYNFEPERIGQILLKILSQNGCPYNGVISAAERMRMTYSWDIYDDTYKRREAAVRQRYLTKEVGENTGGMEESTENHRPKKRRAEGMIASTFVSIHRMESPLQCFTDKLIEDYKYHRQPTISCGEYLGLVSLYRDQICKHEDNRSSPFFVILDLVLYSQHSLWDEWREGFCTILTSMLRAAPPFTQEDVPKKFLDKEKCDKKNTLTSVDCKEYVWKLLNSDDDYENVVIAMIGVCAEKVRGNFWIKACENGLSRKVFEMLKETDLDKMSTTAMEVLLHNLHISSVEVAKEMFDLLREREGDERMLQMLRDFDYKDYFKDWHGHVIVHKMLEDFRSVWEWGEGEVLYHAIQCHSGEKYTEESILNMLDANEKGVYTRLIPASLLYESCKTPKSFQLIQSLCSLFPTATLFRSRFVTETACRLVESTEYYWTGMSMKQEGKWETTKYIMNVTQMAAGALVEWALGPMMNANYVKKDEWCKLQDNVREQTILWMRITLENAEKNGVLLDADLAELLDTFITLNGDVLEFPCYKTLEGVRAIVKKFRCLIDFESVDVLTDMNAFDIEVLRKGGRLRDLLDAMARMNYLREKEEVATGEEFIAIADYCRHYKDLDARYLLIREHFHCVIKPLGSDE